MKEYYIKMKERMNVKSFSRISRVRVLFLYTYSSTLKRGWITLKRYLAGLKIDGINVKGCVMPTLEALQHRVQRLKGH